MLAMDGENSSRGRNRRSDVAPPKDQGGRRSFHIINREEKKEETGKEGTEMYSPALVSVL